MEHSRSDHESDVWRTWLQTLNALEEWSTQLRTKPDSLLIVFDLDGTLVDDALQVKEADLKSIERVRQFGVKATVATGRTFDSALPFVEKLRIELPVIICNGAAIIEPTTGKLLYQRSIPAEMMRTVLSKTADYDLDILIYTDPVKGSPCTNLLNLRLSDFILLEGIEEVELNDLTEVVRRKPVVKVQVVGKTEELSDLRTSILSVDSKVSMVMTKDDYLEIMPPGTSKGESLRELCSFLKMPLAHTLCFGDGRNDIELLRFAGIGVAMANAHDDLKQSADLTTSSVAALLDKLMNML